MRKDFQMRMLKLSLLVWATSLLVPFTTAAQTLPEVEGVCAPEVRFRRAVLEHEGEQGVWFQMDVARCMLGRLVQLPLYSGRVRLLEQRLELSSDRVEILTEAIEVGESIEERYEIALSAALERARDAERSRNAWYRSPGLWAAVGAILAGALVALSAYALSASP